MKNVLVASYWVNFFDIWIEDFYKNFLGFCITKSCSKTWDITPDLAAVTISIDSFPIQYSVYKLFNV